MGTRAWPLRARPVHRAEKRHRRHRLSTEEFFFAWAVGWPLLGVLLGFAGRRWRAVRWPIAVGTSVYALVVLVLFLTHGGPEGVRTFGVVVIAGVTVLSLAPLVSVFTGTRTWTLVSTVLVVLLLVYFLIGLLLWFPVATGLIAASIAGPPALDRR